MTDRFTVELAPPALPLALGSKDKSAVTRLQELLVIAGHAIWRDDRNAPGIDGDFGGGTLAGVQTFAKAFGLEPVVDERFWEWLTLGMRMATSFKPRSKDLGEAIVEVAGAHITQRPREARFLMPTGALVGLDNSGPWVAGYMNERRRDPWCMGWTNAIYDQAARALGVPPIFSPAIGGRAWNLWVPDMVAEARRLGRFVDGNDTARRVRPGSLFFVRGTINGVASHIHIGIVTADMGAEIFTAEGNTNDGGSANGWIACHRKRRRPGLDFAAL